jgi:hypothetical protein
MAMYESDFSAVGHRSATPVAGKWQPLMLFAPGDGEGGGNGGSGTSTTDPSTSHPGLAVVMLFCRFVVESS